MASAKAQKRVRSALSTPILSRAMSKYSHVTMLMSCQMRMTFQPRFLFKDCHGRGVKTILLTSPVIVTIFAPLFVTLASLNRPCILCVIKDVIIRKTNRQGQGLMSQALAATGKKIGGLPKLFTPDARTAERVIEFFTAQIRNANTRKAYARATGAFATWCGEHGISELHQVRPVHVAAYIEGLHKTIAAPSVKLQLAAIRMLFDWLVVSQVVPVNPASPVRG